MTEDRLQEIKSKIAAGTPVPKDDLLWLLSQIEEVGKKNKVLSNHVLELTQEMENIRADFEQGGFR